MIPHTLLPDTHHRTRTTHYYYPHQNQNFQRILSFITDEKYMEGEIIDYIYEMSYVGMIRDLSLYFTYCRLTLRKNGVGDILS
jgi:hypothetical protein